MLNWRSATPSVQVAPSCVRSARTEPVTLASPAPKSLLRRPPAPRSFARSCRAVSCELSAVTNAEPWAAVPGRTVIEPPSPHASNGPQAAGVAELCTVATAPPVRRGDPVLDRREAAHARPSGPAAAQRPASSRLRPAEREHERRGDGAGQPVRGELPAAREVDRRLTVLERAQRDRAGRQHRGEIDVERPGAAAPEYRRLRAGRDRSSPCAWAIGSAKDAPPNSWTAASVVAARCRLGRRPAAHGPLDGTGRGRVRPTDGQ